MKMPILFAQFLIFVFWLSLCEVDVVSATMDDPLDVSPTVFWANIRLSQELVDYFDKRSNPKTGLSLSFYGDSRPIALYGTQIYDIGLRLLADSVYSQQIVDTFARNSSTRPSRDTPQTVSAENVAKEGIFSWIRIEGFDQPQWWNTWEWSIKTGENAWFGKGALHYYRQTRDPHALQLAQERAEFILKLQDKDGAIRVGPENPKDMFWWNVKSTENNESALNFLDEIYMDTHDPRYRQAADRIYEWLVTTMYDRERHLFRRGEAYKDGGWVIDGMEYFSADTTSWAPIQRILEDPRFGADRKERLAEMERMMMSTVAMSGVMQGEVLKGISYSSRSKAAGVISVEWSAQFALRYLLISSEYHDEGMMEKAIEYYRNYLDLLDQLKSYVVEEGGEATVPYAVYPDGRIAADQPMWDDQTRTPRGYAAIAAHIYLSFALRRFDPLVDRNI